MHMLPYVATLSMGACQDVLHQQLEETNCARDTGVGRVARHHTRCTPGPNHFAIIQRGEPRRTLQSLLTKVILFEDTVCELTVSATRGGDTLEEKKPGKAPGLQSKRHCTVSGPQCKCLCFSFESGLRRGLSQMGNIG